MRNKKGFTLTEILGVLVIMGLLLLIIVPTTLNKVRTSENDVKQSQNKMIEESTSIYMDKDKEQYPNVRGNNYCIPVEKMIENGTISDDLKDATSKDPNIKKKIVKVIINEQGNREFEIVGSCKEVEYKHITFSIGPKPNSQWTTSKYVTITYPNMGEGYVNKYSVDNGKTWKVVVGSTKKTEDYLSDGKVMARIEGPTTVKDEYPVKKIDRAAPTITNVAGNPTAWTKGNATLTVNGAKDIGSGLNATAYSFDNGATWQASNQKTYTANMNNIIIKVRDAVGNTYTNPAINITKIDKTAPTITNITGNPTSWTNGNVTLTVNGAKDIGSGLNATAYSFDNGATWQASNQKTYTANTNNIIIKVRDAVGNIYTNPAINITKIDKTVPTVSLNPSAWASYVSGGKAVTVTLADAHSGLKASQPIYYAWTTSNTAVPTSWANVVSTNAAGAKTASVTVPATSSASLTGTYYLWIKAGTLADLSGNVSAKATSGAFKFDNNNPIISNLTASKTTNSITAVATASATSGISKYEFSKDNGATWVSSGTNKTYTFTGLTHNTTYPIKVRVTSGVGKQALSATTNVTTNRIDPPTYVVSPGGNLYTQSKEVTVTAHCTTCTNEYSIDNGKTWVVFPSTVFKIKYISNNVLMARSKDGTNTVSSTCTITNIDQTNPGFVKVNASSKVPGGYLPCDGRAVSRTTYANLFKAIGTTYGAGDGSTTFNLPDFQGRIPIGKSSKYALGSKGGSTDTTLATANLPAHTHTAIAKGTVSSTFTGSSAATASGGAHTHTFSGTTSSNGNHSHTTYHKGYYWINRGTGGEWKYLAYWEQIASDPEREFGRTTSNGAHTHTFSGTTSSNGAHTHTVTPKGSISNTFTGTSATTSSVGSGTSFTNMQPYSVIDYVIKY